MSFEVLKTEQIYPGRAFNVRRDTLCLPDGRETRLDIVDHIGSVVILPIEQNGQLIFIRQYRHAAGKDLLELPAGTLDLGELPEICAHRELREETGMAAGRMELLGGFFLAPGYSTEFMQVYLATDLHHDPLEADADEFLSVERIALAEVFALSDRGEILDAKSLAAFYLARKHLEKLGSNPKYL